VSLRDSILAKNQKKLEPFDVPEWECTVYISTFSARDFNALAKAMRNGDIPDDFFARLVYLCACEEDGTRIFSEADIPKIQDMDAEPVKRVALRAQEINGLGEPSEALAEKN